MPKLRKLTRPPARSWLHMSGALAFPSPEGERVPSRCRRRGGRGCCEWPSPGRSRSLSSGGALRRPVGSRPSSPASGRGERSTIAFTCDFSAFSRRNQTVPIWRRRVPGGENMASNGKNKTGKGNGKLPPTPHPRGKNLRSQLWWDNPENPGMTALYLERYMNFGLTPNELRSGKPIIGIAQTGSDLSPCNRHHLELASRVREGIRAAGGIAFEFPVHPIQETGKRPTAALDRNLAYLGLVEILYGYPLDGVVLMTGCDKTTPACIMAAATVNIPSIVLSGGPMLNGWWKGERCGSGMAVWKA